MDTQFTLNCTKWDDEGDHITREEALSNTNRPENILTYKVTAQDPMTPNKVMLAFHLFFSGVTGKT